MNRQYAYKLNLLAARAIALCNVIDAVADSRLDAMQSHIEVTLEELTDLTVESIARDFIEDEDSPPAPYNLQVPFWYPDGEYTDCDRELRALDAAIEAYYAVQAVWNNDPRMVAAVIAGLASYYQTTIRPFLHSTGEYEELPF